jgi:hypothetical protein
LGIEVLQSCNCCTKPKRHGTWCTDDCEYNLDCFEGYPTYYTKKTWIQDEVEFFFYEMTPEMSSGIPGYLYVSDIVASYKHWNIPSDTLEAVAYANHVRQKTYTF